METDNSKRIRWIPLLLISFSLLFLTGCWDRTEVNDLAIVTGAAIDQKEDDEIELSIQVFVPKAISSGGGQGSGGGGGKITYTASQRGKNIADALSKLQGKFPREIFWGQCKVFIFGEELAKKGIRKQMDFLLRHPEPRERAVVFISEGKAKAILELQPNLERYSAEVIKEILNYRIGLEKTVKDVDEMLSYISSAASIPFVTIKTQQSSEGKSIKYVHIDGAAIFKKDKMVGTISEADTRGVLWLRDEIKGYTVNVEIEGEIVSLNPVSALVHITPTIQGDKWKMDVRIDTEGAIVQNETKIAFQDEKTLKKLEQGYQESIETRIKEVLYLMQHKLNADIAEFSKEYYRKYPKQKKRIEDQWDQIFPNIEVSINVNARIRRNGYINKPGATTQEEVKQW
ncbi:Ger(x)C family spore germination protein [Niallia sp. XMNu-256]|uniref:Ger(x)C family spore germination protein n=1 Tax=Niallia sp. XMNu-256 TaxID=3082444 RepID=UPI0030CAA916